MDLKTLRHMTVTKLRDEAVKFDDLTGVHGMGKEELIDILKGKFGIADALSDVEELIERKHAAKAKMRKLKAQKARAQESGEKEKAALLYKRLRSQRRVLRKLSKRAKAAHKVD